MTKEIFNFIKSLLKDPQWRKELSGVCPCCVGRKTVTQSICWGCINAEMRRFHSDPQQDYFPSQISSCELEELSQMLKKTK